MSTTTARQFWDKVYSEDAIGPPHDCCHRALAYFGDVKGKTVLDLGCGRGENTLFWAEQGASVTAIDISPVAIERLQKATAHLDVVALVWDAFEISQLGHFDFVFGQMILHHLEPFDLFAEQLSESFTDKAFFYENNSMSRLLVWCREHLVGKLWIPERGDPDEFPLMPQEIDLLRRYMTVDVKHPEMMFLRLISAYLLGGHLRSSMIYLDDLLYKIPSARRMSYLQDLLIGHLKENQRP